MNVERKKEINELEKTSAKINKNIEKAFFRFSIFLRMLVSLGAFYKAKVPNGRRRRTKGMK